MVDGTLTVLPPKSTISGELTLRIHGGNHDGQIVRLRSRKCTIGSGPQCTLRLRARGVLPLHCLVVRGSTAVIVRRWAPDTRLNGHDFQDAELNVGDILSVGPLQIEIVSLATGDRYQRQTSLAVPAEQVVEIAETAATRETDEAGDTDRTSDVEAQLAEVESQRDDLQTKRDRWQQEQAEAKEQLDRQAAELQQRVAELDAQAAELAERQDDLNRQKQQLETEQGESGSQLAARADELQSQLAEVESQRDDLQTQRDRWQQEQADSQAHFEQKSAELEAQAKDLHTRTTSLEERAAQIEAREEELQREQQQLEAERAENQQRRETESEEIRSQLAQLESRQEEFQRQHSQLEQEKIDLQQQIDSQTQQLNSAQEELQQQRQQWADEQTAADNRLSERLERIEAREADLDTRAEHLRRQCVELDAQRQAVEKASQAEPAPPEVEIDQTQPTNKNLQDSPVDLAEVLNRVGGADLLPSDEANEQEPQAEQQVVASAAQSNIETAAEEQTDDEESIDDYMSRLIQRVSGNDKQPRQPQIETQLLEQEKEPIKTPRSLPRLIEPTDVEPRAKAPEKQVDLTAMRQLANVSAHTAIDKHVHRQMIGAKRSKLLVSTVGLLGGGMLLWMWWNLGVATLAYYAALVSFMVALLWGIEYAVITGRMIVDRSGHLDWKSLDESANPTEDEHAASHADPHDT